MRTIVDIPDSQIEILNQLSKKKKTSRAEIIRLALAGYIAEHNKTKKGFKHAFGIWQDRKIDSVTYQQNLRDEWVK
jgi:metal-responsive CopG/Arc/MetJ family transcriptional regulator